MRALLLISTFILLQASSAFANFTYEGTLTDPSGNIVTSNNVVFTLKILSPGAEACVLFQETHTLDMSTSNGYFSLEVGAGTGSNSYTLKRIFENYGTLSGLSCVTGTSFAPTAALARKMAVAINVGGGPTEQLGVVSLNSVPLADSAQTLLGFKPEHLLRAVDGSNAPVTAPALTPAMLGEFLALLNGTSSLYAASSVSTGSHAPVLAGSPATPQTGSFWYDSISMKMKYYNGSSSLPFDSGGTVVNVNVAAPLTVSSPTTTPNITLPQAGSSTSGYLSDTDWNNFNNKIDTSMLNALAPNSIRAGSNQFVLNGGNVGIGTSTPAYPLDVSRFGAGAVAVFQSTDNNALVKLNSPASYESSLIFSKTGMQRWKMGANNSAEGGGNVGSNFQIANFDDAGTPISVSLNIMRQNGFVGIGTGTPASKLSVAGGILLGYDPDSCITPKRGTLRLSLSYKLEFCDGTSWVSVLTDSGYENMQSNTVDFSSGPTVIIGSAGGSVISLSNMMPGNTYTIYVEDLTNRTYTFGGQCTTSKFNPTNGNTAGYAAQYQIFYRSNGTCYIQWKTFQ